MAVTLPWFLAVDHLPTGSDAVAAYAIGDGALTQVSGTSSTLGIGTDPILSRNVLRLGVETGVLCYVDVPAQVRVATGFRFRHPATQTNGLNVVTFRDASNNILVRMALNTGTTQWDVYSGVTLLGSVSAADLTSWGYWEIAAELDTVDGSVQVRRDGVELLNVSGIDTGAVSCARVRWSGPTTGINNMCNFTDLYVRTFGVAESPFYGPILMRRLTPASDVAANWDASESADNYEMVDDATMDSDSTYVETNVLNTEDQYELGDLPSGVNSIIAVVGVTVGQAPNGGAPLVAHTAEVSATKVTGDGRTLGAAGTYRTQQTVWTTAPDASAWSEAKANALRLGIKAS